MELPTIDKKPEIKITELTPFKVKFTLSGCDLATANTLRRAIIAYVPTLAIDTVEIIENTSSLNDEFIVHRLGLIPLRCSSNPRFENMKNTKECQCDYGCPNCTVRFNLDVTCHDDVRKVTSKDLICSNEAFQPAHFICEEDRNNEIDGIRIMDLARGQQLKLTATATIGIGKMHAKWSPVATAVFRYEPIITINQQLLNEEVRTPRERQEICDICPKKIFKYNKIDNTITIENPNECLFCGDCELLNEKYTNDKLIDIKYGQDHFYFTVETTGAMSPEDIVISAFNELTKKCALLSNSI